MLKIFFNRVRARSIIVFLLVVGSLYLAILDHTYRPIFGDLTKIAIGGYLSQMIPSNYVKPE